VWSPCRRHTAGTACIEPDAIEAAAAGDRIRLIEFDNLPDHALMPKELGHFSFGKSFLTLVNAAWRAVA
jgi:hypothetical protein